MKCEEYFVLLCGHLDGMNDKNEEERLQAHLHSCEECRELLAQMRENDAALRETQEIPADLTQKIMQKVRKEPKKQKKRYWNVVASGFAAAAVLAVVILGGNGLRMPHAEEKAEAAPARCAEVATEAPFLTGGMLENEQIVLHCEPMETDGQYSYVPAPGFDAKSLTDEWYATEDSTFFAYGSTTLSANAAEKATVLFVFASEVKELGEHKALDLTKISLQPEAKERYEALATEDTAAYRVSFSQLLQIKEAYPSEYFDGSTENCYVFVIPSP